MTSRLDRLRWAALLLPPVLAGLACGGRSTDADLDEAFFPPRFTDTYIQVRNCRFSSAHDGHNILVYASPGQAGAYVDGDYPLAQGTVLVKVLHSDPGCKTLAGYVAMRKGGAGTAPDGGDWEWQELDANRKILESGRLPSCIGCHTGCTEGRDFTCTDP